MHRTTTTATLLVTVAVSALAGCVTVLPPAASGSPTAPPPQPSVPRQDGHTPQIVQAPAREALERVGGARQAEPAPSASPRPPAAPSPAGRPPHPHPRAQQSERPRRQPHLEFPDVSEAVRKDVRRDTDVCELGRKYGGWQADSPEAVICEAAYGR